MIWSWKDYVSHLKDEIAYLRNQVDQARIENVRLQQMLNQVTPAGRIQERIQNPPTRPNPTGPTVKRWAQIEQERFAEIEANRLKKLAEGKAGSAVNA